MARLFLSYDREDAARAGPIAEALERAGHFVWWDRHIKGGAQFSKEIEQALAEADAVIVLWSKRSVESAWVRDEAAAGRDTGRLVPARLDGAEPPLGFRQFHTIDLSGRGGGRSKGMKALLAALDGPSRASPAMPPGSPVRSTAPKSRLRLFVIAGVVLLAALVAGGLLYRQLWGLGSDGALVAVRAADQSAGSIALARDLLVRMGDYEAAHPSETQLTDGSSDSRPDMIIEVSGPSSGAAATANVVLLRGRDRMLLASQDVASSSPDQEELRQAVAATAARLTHCAAGAMKQRPALPSATLRLYLTACNRFAGLYGSDDISLILPQLEQITKQQPSFRPAWRLLLLGGSSLVALPSDQPKPSREWLQRQIAMARQVDPNMVEIMAAEIELLPVTAFAARIDKAAKLAEAAADDPAILDIHAEQLLTVGRLNEAVSLTERAALLDPISPATRAAYIRALTYSGRVPSAIQELREAAALLLGSKNMLEARFRLNMRYGDPKDALDLLRRYGTSKAHESFLLARIEPTAANVERAIAVSQTVANELQLFGTPAEVLSAFGRDDEVYRLLMGLRLNQVEQSLLSILFRPSLSRQRQNPRFLHVAKRYGLLDYWRSSGKWPDFCSDPDLPYDCRMEAAKLP